MICVPAFTATFVGGTFRDRDGAVHPWTINDAHSLIWDAKPYIPVGGLFCAKYLTQGQTEQNWAADVEALKTIKSKGITDIYINPVHGATSIPLAAWQKLVDHLETEGFRYGIELTDGPKKPLQGWILRPSVYRLAGIAEDKTIELNIPNLQGGIWVLADAAKGDILKTGTLTPIAGKVNIPVQGKPDAKRVLLVYPVKALDPGTDGLQNLWEGYPEYRDRLLSHFQDIKLGAGFRFWVDPFINEMGLRGETPYMIPASASYRLEFEAWLHKKYGDFGKLARAWGLSGDIRSYEEAAQLIPLWQGHKGLTYYYNTITGGTSRLSGPASQVWDDLTHFRNESIRGYLNDIASVLKRKIADAPVVVKWTATHDYLINDLVGGFDGIGVEAYGEPGTIGPYAGAQCLAIVEQASRPMWLLTTETQSTSAAAKDGQGYKSQEQLLASLAALKDSGSKGFFVFGLNLSPPWTNFDLTLVPDQLGWLGAFQARLSTETLFGEWRPRTVWFSARNPYGADISRLERDLWWLPKRGDAREVPVEPGIRAYAIEDAQGTAIYIWSTGIPRTIDVSTAAGFRPTVYFTGNEPRSVKNSKSKVTIPLTKDPVILRGMPVANFLTVDGLAHQLSYLTKLVEKAEAMSLPIGDQKMALENAKHMIKSDSMQMASTTLARAIMELEPMVAPFDWVEGENATETNFDEVAYTPGASATRYLSINTSLDPPLAPYSASLAAYVSADADYAVWLAGSPVGTPEASAVSWNVDESSWMPIKDIVTTGNPYASGLYWSKIGTLHLTRGKHVLRFRLDGRRKQPDNNYVMSIDALMITREPFRPDGARRPDMQ